MHRSTPPPLHAPPHGRADSGNAATESLALVEQRATSDSTLAAPGKSRSGRRSTFLERICARKPIESVQKEINEAEYKRPLTAWDLTLMGIGGIIGAGIFVLTGKAAAKNAGPGIIISFVISGIVCVFACLCYAELGSTLPVSGSAYSFTYAALGELLAWIVGWDLMLDDGCRRLGRIPRHLRLGPCRQESHLRPALVECSVEGTPNVTDGFYLNKIKCLDGSECQAVFNIPAFVIVVAITILLVLGIREAAWVNNTMVIIKLVVTVMFILTGIKFINNANYTPFVPPNEGKGQYGLSGIFEASVSVFFAYIGFDAVTTTAQEAANPQRDLPIGIIGSLGICTILYIAVSSVLVGMVPYRSIDLKAPVGQALIDVGLPAMAVIISFGALVGLTSVMITLMIGQPRIFYSMAYDGLLPPVFSRIHSKFGTPYITTIFSGTLCALLAGLLPVDLLGNLTSVGTLSAFFLVSVSTLVLRITQPDLPRKFQIPGGFWFGGVIVPFLSAFFSAGLFSQATVASIARVFIWMAIGLVIYFSYGFWHSKVGALGKPAVRGDSAETIGLAPMDSGDV
ncbi:hypothetical protein HK105_206539 [Polyrhizophydium stewartii]|uniref:Cationic amino acid transporter n=1 Tax=Polyrhizophydium stewartii TaxID=2732419 RepID=A0ABR4N371_9FUNG